MNENMENVVIEETTQTIGEGTKAASIGGKLALGGLLLLGGVQVGKLVYAGVSKGLNFVKAKIQAKKAKGEPIEVECEEFVTEE